MHAPEDATVQEGFEQAYPRPVSAAVLRAARSESIGEDQKKVSYSLTGNK
jgi:hypothetical protein